MEGPWTLVGTPAAPPFTDPGLSPGTTYLYRVSALSGDARCESRRSACVVGVCASAPTFSGAASATSDAAASCGITLSWSGASSACPGGSFVYNLYRDTNPSFTPGPGNLLARCVAGTSYHDTAQLVSGTPVTYIVRAEDSRIAGSGACSGGASDANTARVTATPAGPPQAVFGDGFETGLGNWVATQWASDGTVAHSGLMGRGMCMSSRNQKPGMAHGRGGAVIWLVSARRALSRCSRTLRGSGPGCRARTW